MCTCSICDPAGVDGSCLQAEQYVTAKDFVMLQAAWQLLGSTLLLAGSLFAADLCSCCRLTTPFRSLRSGMY